MSITELTEKVKASAKARTPEQRMELLRKAHILDKSGHYDVRFFSTNTVQKNRERTDSAKD
ncbi:MAG: hypothetical protein Q7U16_14505 [Agitococcus sp.]|nr:hypothetical protein [Agitococcus sp.]